MADVGDTWVELHILMDGEPPVGKFEKANSLEYDWMDELEEIVWPFGVVGGEEFCLFSKYKGLFISFGKNQWSVVVCLEFNARSVAVEV